MRKLSKIQKLRVELGGKLHEAEEALQICHTAMAAKDDRINMLEIRLSEARRHTLPFGESGQNGHINFMPIAVVRLESKFDTCTVRSSMSGIEERVPMHQRCELVVIADMMDSDVTPVVYP